MLAGDPSAEQICHQYTASEDSLLPADQDTATNPPSGQDQFFIGSVGDVDTSHLSLYSAHINDPSDWSQGATWTGDGNSQLIAIASFNPACNGRMVATAFRKKASPTKSILSAIASCTALPTRMTERGLAALAGEL